MKKYKNLIPLLLVCFMALSIYSDYAGAKEKTVKITENLALARENRKKGIVQDALTYYEKVMALEKNFAVELEVGKMLEEAELYKEAEEWGEHLVDKFPKEPEAYSFLLAQYIVDRDYESSFQLNDKAVNNGCDNETFHSLMAEIDYLYEYAYGQYEDVVTFSAGMAAGLMEGDWQLVDSKGNATAYDFQKAGLYNGEVFPVKRKGKWQYATTDGSKKIDISKLGDCEELGSLTGNVFKAKCKGVYGYYTIQMEKIADGFEAASSMNEGLGAVSSKGKWKILDSEGVQVGKEYKDIVINARDVAYQNERIWVSDDGKRYYMIDAAGERVGKKEVEAARGFTVTDEPAAVAQDGKWGFMDNQGEMVIEPQYEDARSFCNGYAAVKQKGVWGFIDAQGEMVIEPQFADARDFSDGSVFVKRGDKFEMLMLYRNNYK